MLTNRLICCAASLGLLFTSPSFTQTGTEKVLIRTPKPYTGVIQAIRARGGRVTREFKYIDGIAAEVPRAAIEAVHALVGAGGVSKDLIIPKPAPVDTLKGRNFSRKIAQGALRFQSARMLSAAQVTSLAKNTSNPDLVNNAIAGASSLHSLGIEGQGVVVAVIDSGIRPGFAHLSVDNSVIGCEDFVNDGLGCSNFANDGHGTFVAGMISANTAFTLPPSSEFRNAVLSECPNCFLDAPANTVIPMIGSAPLASIYALRVLPPIGGSPASRTIAAIERVIELREKYDLGLPGGVNIQVCNLSLGGPTLYAGRDLLDQSVDALLLKDIIPVISASNSGPAALTIGSPGSAINALTVGAASLARNERILRRTEDPVNGPLFRPFSGTQIAFFSSRGPNADGRADPDIVANGFACFGQGTGFDVDSVSLGSGTSFATATVSGIAALLRGAFPGVHARKIRNAIVLSANPGLIADGSVELDRGRGYVDAQAAYKLLASRDVPDTLPAPGNPTRFVAANLRTRAGVEGHAGFARERISNLKPGQRHDIFYHVPPNAREVTVILNPVTRSLPPSQQNQIFGDDVLLAIHTAKTSSIGDAGDYPYFLFTAGGTFVVNNPEFGVMRISVSGDWTNAGEVSAEVIVFDSTLPVSAFTVESSIIQGQSLLYPFFVPAGTKQAEFRATWTEDWSNYPANDLDLILIGPNGTFNFDGATLSNPESAIISSPADGVWLALIDGIDVNTRQDRVQLRVTLDGRLVQ